MSDSMRKPLTRKCQPATTRQIVAARQSPGASRSRLARLPQVLLLCLAGAAVACGSSGCNRGEQAEPPAEGKVLEVTDKSTVVPRDPTQMTAEQIAALRARVDPVSPAPLGGVTRAGRFTELTRVTLPETAADALARIGEPALRPLIETLRDPNPQARLNAVRALSKMGPAAREAVPDLARLLRSDPDEQVRQNAARALGQIGPDAAEAIPALIEAMHAAE